MPLERFLRRRLLPVVLVALAGLAWPPARHVAFETVAPAAISAVASAFPVPTVSVAPPPQPASPAPEPAVDVVPPSRRPTLPAGLSLDGEADVRVPPVRRVHPKTPASDAH